MSYINYANICNACTSFGWLSSWVWSRDSFRPNYLIYPSTLKQNIKALTRTDLFIACVPGTCSTQVEIGLAYSACEELFLCAKDPVYFQQTSGLGDAHMAALPGMRRAVCRPEEIPEALYSEYYHLVKTAL
jgi:hypothetical protein